MTFFRSERGIGRGEPAESRLEFPFFMLFMVCCTVALLYAHFHIANPRITLALAISMAVFGLTILRVDLGVYCISIAMLLSPEIDAGGVGSGERRLTMRYDDVLILVIFVGVLVKQAFQGKRHIWLSSPVNAGIVAYYSVCLLSTFLGLRLGVPAYDKQAAFFIMLKMAQYYMVFLLVGSAINSAAQVRNQLLVFFVVAFAVNVYSLYARHAFGRVSAPFETGGTEPNTVGGYLVLVMSIAAGLMMYAPTRGLKLAYAGVIAVSFLPFLLALSRASYVAFLVAALALGLLARRPGVIMVLLLGLAFSPVLMPEEVKDRVNYTFQRGSGQPVNIGRFETGLQVDKSTYERIYVWEKVRFNLETWPWLGGGVGWGHVLDSQYARVIIETGLLGIAAFLFLQYRILQTARQTHWWSTDWIGKGLGLGATVAIIGLIVHSLGTITFLIVRIMGPFWFIMALTVVCREYAIDEYWERERQRINPPEPRREPGIRGAPAPADSIRFR